MAIPTLTGLPDSFESGDTILFSESFGEYPAGTWQATIYFSVNGAAPTSVAATADGTNHLFTLSAAFTAALTAGINNFAIRVTSSGENATPKSGEVYVLPNLAAAQTQSTAALQLAAANTAFSSLLSGTNSSVSFNGQSFTKKDQKQLWEIIQRLKAVVQAEKNEQAALRGDSMSRSIRPFFQ